MWARKVLLRTALLAREALVAFRREKYDYSVNHLSVEGDVVVRVYSVNHLSVGDDVVVKVHCEGRPLDGRRFRFPSDTAVPVRYQEAALLMNCCSLTSMLVGKMIEKLLSGSDR